MLSAASEILHDIGDNTPGEKNSSCENFLFLIDDGRDWVLAGAVYSVCLWLWFAGGAPPTGIGGETAEALPGASGSGRGGGDQEDKEEGG